MSGRPPAAVDKPNLSVGDFAVKWRRLIRAIYQYKKITSACGAANFRGGLCRPPSRPPARGLKEGGIPAADLWTTALALTLRA